MTTNNIASSIMQSLYYAGAGSSTASPAAASFSVPATAAPTATPTNKDVDNTSDSAFKSALAKLSQISPALSQKIQAFQAQSDPTAPSPTAAPNATVVPPDSGLKSVGNRKVSLPGHGHHKPRLDPVTPPSTVAPPSSTAPSATAGPTSQLKFLGYRFSQGQSLAGMLQAQSPDLAESLFATAA